MAEIPWFAWIAIVAIIMWGLVMIVGNLTGRQHKAQKGSSDREEIEYLRRRIEELEAQLRRGA